MKHKKNRIKRIRSIFSRKSKIPCLYCKADNERDDGVVPTHCHRCGADLYTEELVFESQLQEGLAEAV